ncbi:MAG: immunoglobulin-like domain-containing protein [Ignavibacteriales bacterium]
MKNKKGFTLIELLAVIVILAIISVITVPIVIGIINRVRMASYKESVRSIFEATNVYLASDKFTSFPKEGINITSANIKMKNKDFTGGKIFRNDNNNLEVERVSNNVFCGSGTLSDLKIVEGSCDQLDVTPPTVNVVSNLVTSSSITIVATGEDLESGINGYQFSKDNGTTWTNKQTSNVYAFNGLTNNISYTFKVRAINNNQLSTISNSITVTTNDIPIPTYSINTTAWVSSVVVTITYPARETGFVYQYSLDNALTWLTVDAPAITKDITFTDNGSVIARILDGTNEISGTNYTVANIDKYNPSVGITVVGSPFNANGWAKANFNVTVSGTDNESGVKSYTYCQTTSATCAPTTVVNSTSGTVTIVTEGTTNKVCAFSTDNVNNNSSVVCSSAYKLDKTAPIITVTPLTINITLGETYSDTGVSASDNIDGNITSSIIKTGNVNTSLAGSYKLTYNVSDTAGNAATTVERTVTVTPITEYRYRTSSTSTSCSTCYDTCYSYTTGTASYSCSSGTLSGSTCTTSSSVYSTFTATYSCSGGAWVWSSQTCSGNCNAPCSNGTSVVGAYEYSSSCPPAGSCTSGTSTCYKYWTGTCYYSSPANVTYVCPSGYTGGGASSSCSTSYSCNQYSCNCSTTTTWGSWSSWSTTPVTSTSTRQVETRSIMSI